MLARVTVSQVFNTEKVEGHGAPQEFHLLLEEKLSECVIGLAIEVHREVGPGLLEPGDERCLCREFERPGIEYRQTHRRMSGIRAGLIMKFAAPRLKDGLRRFVV